jgi:hypothetical protein
MIEFQLVMRLSELGFTEATAKKILHMHQTAFRGMGRSIFPLFLVVILTPGSIELSSILIFMRFRMNARYGLLQIIWMEMPFIGISG